MNACPPPQGHTNGRKNQTGFILIYVVSLVAALAIILYQLSLSRNGVPGQFERQVVGLLEAQEIRTLEQSIISGLAQQALPLDPRYLSYRRLQETDPARLSTMADAIQQLQALLAELNFKINLPGTENEATTTSKNEKQATEFIHDGNTIAYSPRPEPYVVTLGNRTYRITIRPANAFPNLNTIEYEPLWRYLALLLKTNPSDAQSLAAAIIDWRDTDDVRTAGIGAERESYLSLGYVPRNRPIQSWQELAYLRNMTPVIIQTLRDNFYLAPASAPARVMPDFITPEGLAALADLKVEFVKAILQEYGKLQTAPTTSSTTSGNSGILFTADGERFDKVIAWGQDATRLRIEIAGSNHTLHLDYDTTLKKVTNRW